MKTFTKAFQSACGRHHPSKVWGDFCYMAAAAFSTAVDKRHAEKREERYLQIINTYTPEEQQVFPELVALMVQALEKEPFQDFLGKQYMELGMGNSHAGQFFTPYNVCRAMAEMSIPGTVGDMIQSHGYITIHDCACGAGATLIAAAEVMHQRGIDYQRNALFAAQDLDYTAAMMCYIQMSLLGIAGYVRVGNTLTDPMTGSVLFGPEDEDTWYTPMFFHQHWQLRRELAILRHVLHSTDLDAPQPMTVPAPEAPKEAPPPAPAEPLPVIELADAKAHGQIQGQLAMVF